MSKTKTKIKAGAKEPEVNEVYENNRGELKRIIYIDNQIVLLRGEQKQRNNNNNVHYIDQRSDFNAKIDQDRLEINPNADPNIPLSGQTDESEKTVKENERAPTTEPESKKPTPSTEDEKPTPDEREDWDKVDNIGEEIANSLYEMGIKTKEDVQNTQNRKLEDVDGLGNKGIKNLIQYASPESNIEQWSELPYIGNKTEQNLYDNGFKSKKDIQSARSTELESVNSLGEKGIEQLKKHASKLTHP